MSEGITELSDVIGNIGIYQVAYVIMSLHHYSYLGCSLSFIQFLAPDIDISIENGTSGNQTIFKSTSCQLQLTTNRTNMSAHQYYTIVSHHKTLTEQLGLICEKSWLVSLSKSAVILGILLGSFLFGLCSERFGRKPVGIGAFIPIIAVNIWLLFTSNYVTFIVGCFIYGLTAPNLNLSSYISMLEHFPVNLRAKLAVTPALGVIVGQLAMALLDLIFKDWFYTQIAYLVYIVSSFPLLWYCMESPLWLVVRGKDKEAEHVITTIVKRNRRNLENVEQKIALWLQTTKKRSMSMQSAHEWKIQDLFTSPIMRKYTFVLLWNSIATILPLYGLATNEEILGVNIYYGVFIGCAVSTTACIMFILLPSSVPPRKSIVFVMCIFVSASCLYPILYENTIAGIVLLEVLNGLAIPISSVNQAYSSEVFPTSIRGLGISFLRGGAGVMGFVAPFARELATTTKKYVPVLLYGLIMFPSILLLLKVLPETKGRPLIQTVEELEASLSKKKQSSNGNSEHCVSHI